MNIDSLYFALAREKLYDCIRPAKKKKNGKHSDSRTVMTLSKQMLYKSVLSIRSLINGNQAFSRKNSIVRN